jgi:hypothetical protein
MWRPDDTTETFVAWEQHCMSTGGVWTIRIWWVPQFAAEEVSMPPKEVSSDVPF